jgi:crotonobetainyl-CoA:carnitine CoA-transferase CaiB-like acyl-CoA transferase
LVLSTTLDEYHGNVFTVSISGATTEQITTSLQAAGIPAAIVYTADRLASDQYLEERRYFADVTSPTLGQHRIPGLPWQLLDAERDHVAAAPEVPAHLLDSTPRSTAAKLAR